MKKLLLTILSLLIILNLLASCSPMTPSVPDGADTTLGEDVENANTTPTVTDEVIEPVPVLPDGLILAGPDQPTVACIVYSQSSADEKALAESLAKHINTAIPTANVAAISDAGSSATEYEILVGGARGLAPLALDGKNYAVSLQGKQLRLCGKDSAALEDAVDYLKLFGFCDGYFVIDEALNYASGDAAYTVLTQSPEKFYYYEDVYTPTLVYTFKSGVNAEGSRVSVGGIDVTGNAIWSEGSVTVKDFTVPAGDHTVLVGLADGEGDVSIFETTFSCGDGSVMHLYSGEVHAHTSDSDGQSTVKEAYAYARDVAKLDFFSVTDHSDSFKNEVYQNSHIPNADYYNDPGKFVALYGYEQTYNHKTGYYGHLNTINYGSLTSRNTPLVKYYEIMAKDPNSIVMFNHPGYTWGNFLEYGNYSELYDSVVNLAEIKGKNYDKEYALSLTKGWHVSPMYNEDNHSANWGNAYEYCGYALAPALTRQNIVEAFQKNRTYTTTDKSLKIYYKINDEWMGGRLDNPDKLRFSIELSTEKAQGLGTVSIIGEDNIVVAYKPVGTKKSFTWELELDPCYDYYYVKVESGGTWCVTAPIWVENREQITIEEMYQELVVGTSAANDHRIYAKVKNNTDQPMTNVTVDFYISSTAGFNSARARADATVTIGNMIPGETAIVYADLKYSYTMPRIYAVANATQNEQKYGAVKYMEISNLYFSEIVALTSVSSKLDTYEFIELYNNSDSVLDLSDFSIRFYPKSGAKAADLTANTWKLSGKIQPHSTMVLWMVREDNTLTVADFNKRYGTSLVQGKDIVIIKGNEVPHTNAVQLELLSGSTVVGRVWYNFDLSLQMSANRAVNYLYPTDYTFTAKVNEKRISPTPGKLAENQMPAIVKQ